MSLLTRIREAVVPERKPYNGECPVTGELFYYERNRRCPSCGCRLWFDGTPGVSHRRKKEAE